jgi:hypothetical protein
MALVKNKLQEILPLLPKEIHGKTKEIYRQIPGSLLNFFEPNSTTKKAECRGHDLPVDSSVSTPCDDGRNYHDQNLQISHHGDLSKSNHNNQSHANYPEPVDHDNKYANALRFHLQNSIKRSFSDQNITEVFPNFVADDIVQKCFQQCPDWGRKQCETPSMIVRFDNNYIDEQKSKSLNVNVYIYAYLSCEREESLFSRLREPPPKIKFEVTIELNSLAISCDKIAQFCQLLSENAVPDVIKRIEATDKVTWNNLDKQSSKPSVETTSSLTWDDI